MKPKSRNFRDLEVWQLGKRTALQVYQTTKLFPKQEIYGITNQMRKAAVSIPSNIAEGFNRFHNREYRQFLYVALGSCGELETQIELSCELEYMSQVAQQELLESLNHESKMLRSLIKKL